jgi:DNA polymerase V
MIIFAHTSRFIESPRSSSLAVNLPTGSNFTPELLKYATTALRQIYEPHCPYKKAGVIMTGLHPENERQGVLWSPPRNLDREQRLSQIIDQLNHRYGAETLSFGLVGHQQPWRIRCNQRSPRFTTHWDELPLGKANFDTI